MSSTTTSGLASPSTLEEYSLISETISEISNASTTTTTTTPKMSAPKVKVAVVQAEPVWFDLQGTVDKTIALIKEAASKGCELIAFPEVFIPGYPLWIWSNAADLDLNINYIKNSLSMDSPQFQSIIDTIKACSIHTVLGFSERVHGSVYLSQCIINKKGEIVLHRRKFKPTHVERAIYGEAKSQDLISVKKLDFADAGDVEVGALSCWEHVQPLLTFNSATQQEKIHIGAWPMMDHYNPKTYSFYSFSKDAFHDLARAYAMQTGSFYLFTHQVITDKILEKIGSWPPAFKTGIGAAAIYGPDGAKLTEDLGDYYDGLLIHDLDMDAILLQKQLVDIVGHYSRTDIISINVHQANANPTQNEYLTEDFIRRGSDKKLEDY
ncbi:Nitrilase [Cyberlindnera fabianii]|uniref:nitrilase n=1 Tax=Cyberlindnera fabianii TaxID=36022 RepID=A0A1V2KYP0_CYBFA|nr:Nitrilase [Cyberlindnera fabianii]